MTAPGHIAEVEVQGVAGTYLLAILAIDAELDRMPGHQWRLQFQVDGHAAVIGPDTLVVRRLDDAELRIGGRRCLMAAVRRDRRLPGCGSWRRGGQTCCLQRGDFHPCRFSRRRPIGEIHLAVRTDIADDLGAGRRTGQQK